VKPKPLIIREFLGCRRCPLSETRSRICWGIGPEKARIMVIGQSPGAEEDAQGKPLVGPSGKFLASHFRVLGVDMDTEVFRTNVNHCHPPGNREATPQEIKACRPLLEAEIQTVDPDVIIVLGATALKAILPGEKVSISAARGNVYRREILGRERYVVPALHPAAVLRNRTAHARNFLSDIRTAVEVARGCYTPPESIPFRKTAGTLEELLEAAAAPEWGFDLETTTGFESGISLRSARVIGVGICAVPGNGIYYQCSDPEEARRVMELLRPRLEDPAVHKIVSNVKFERHICRNYGIELRGWDDTMLMAWVAGDFPTGLKDGFQRAFGLEMERIDVFYQRKFKAKHPVTGKYVVDMLAAQEADPEAVAAYAAQDPDASLRLYRYLERVLKNRGLWELYRGLEVPFNDVIVDMERTGMHFEAAALEKAAADIRAAYAEVMKRLEAVTGQPEFPVNSWREVARLLYDEDTPYRIPVVVKDGKEARPTGAVDLAAHPDNQLIRDILTARAILKLEGTYINTLPKWVDPQTGRIHPEYRQAAVATGRLSSANPNATNIPSRKRQDIAAEIDGSLIRRAFTAPPGWSICGIDLSQIEMRVAAHLCGDEAMIRELSEGGDIHSNTARAIYRTTEEEVGPKRWKEMRALAKTIGFGSLYGLAAPGLIRRAPTLNLTLKDAEEFIEGFYRAYPKLREWQRSVIAFARQNGYSETILGRRRYFEDITSTDRERRGEAERGAINHPVQGSAADFFKLGVLRTKRWIEENGSRAKIVALVHDELVLEAPNEELEWLYENIPPLMASAIPLKVPVFVDFECGPSWGEVEAPPWVKAKEKAK